MLDPTLESKLIKLAGSLIDQDLARTIVPPLESLPGFWFGGGNLTRGPDGDFYLVGRYRNSGDSRTGLASGTRGLKLAIFRSSDQCETFQSILELEKQDLNTNDHTVLSIEGTALRFRDNHWELFVSTEKQGVPYPEPFGEFQKPGTGVWSVDRLCAPSIDALPAAAVQPVLASSAPETIHVKDPFLYQLGSADYLFFCSHPFNWTCSATGYVLTDRADAGCVQRVHRPVFEFFPRGNVWDIAMSRGTCIIDVPHVGRFAERDVQLMFYDGGECVRNLDAHANAVDRPRGYSCEELGGAAYFINRDWSAANRLSRYAPLFVSPSGTGCSRYVDVFFDGESLIATWQQSQSDGSQPLVLHQLAKPEIESILS